MPLRRFIMNRWTIQFVIVATLLTVAIIQIDLKALGQSFAHARVGWLLIALAVYVGSRLVHAAEWQVTLTRVGRAPFFGLFGVLLIGTLVNAVVPASAGDVVKIQIVANRYGLPRAGLIAGRGAEGLVNAVFIVAFIVVSFALPNVGFASRNLLWLLAGATALLLLVAVLTSRMLPEAAPQWRLLARLPRRLGDGVQRHWPRFHEGLEVIRSPRLLSLEFAFNLVGWLLDILIFWAIGQALNLHLPLAAYVSVTVVIGILTIFPITFGNLGTFELAVVAALALYGVPADDAVAYAVGAHLFSTVVNVGLGVAAMLFMGMHPSEVFRLRRPKPLDRPVTDPLP